MELVDFQEKYLDEVIALWNECLPYDLICASRFRELVLEDENFSPKLCKIALNEGKVIGFVWAVKRKVPYLTRGIEETRGWINLMFIHPDFRGRHMGTELLKAVEAELAALGVQEITLCAYSPNYLTPGIDLRYQASLAFFEKQEYNQTGNAVSMQRALWDYTLSKQTKQKLRELQDEGIRIIPYQGRYREQLLVFLEREFGAGWVRNALLAIEKKEAQDTILLCIDGNETILGYCMRKIDGNDARFGPIGVDGSLRSKGLGGVLLDVMMEDMKKRAIYYLYFLWTGGDGQRFYERHGIQPYREYRLYRKEIGEL